MKKIFFTAALALMSIVAAQAKKVYIEMIFDDNVIKIDDGTNKKRQPIKNEKGKTLKFHSLIGALNYMSSEGWELVETKSTVSGKVKAGGDGETGTDHYYILCKDVSDGVLIEVVNQSIK